MTFRTLEEAVVATAEGVRPAERLTVSQAAEKYRMLKNPGSYVGPWQNFRTPYLVEPMDTLDSLEKQGMIFVGPARTGKSDMFFNWLVKTVHCDPADMMIVHMTQNTARDWSQGDLNKAIRNTPVLKDKLKAGKQNSNVHDKSFISGMKLLIKWPTITELSGKTIPRLWLMDYDRMKQDVDGEGNPFDLARKRAETFKRFGMCVAEASPGFPVKDAKWMPSTPHEAPPTEGILALYNRGDRRRWYWRCPQCNDPFEPRFKLLSYPKSADKMESAEQVTLVCPHCGFPITPDYKKDLNEHGRWVKEGQTWLPDGSMVGQAVRSDIASFWMFGPAAGFSDWKKLVFNYLNAEEEYEKTGSEEGLKTTITVDQGEAYKPKAMESDRLPETLQARAQDWGGSAERPVVPVGVRFLVATIDVQAGGRPSFVVQVHGIGPGGDFWLVDMFKIRKSNRKDKDGERELIDPAAYPEDWRLLIDQVMLKTYPLADGSGRHMSIKATGCDSGGKEGVTTNAYNFWRYLKIGPPAGSPDAEKWVESLHRRFHLIKGDASKNQPRIRLGYPDSPRSDRHAGARGDVPVLFLNTNMLKDVVSGMLGREDAVEDTLRVKVGQVNFPKWAEGWLYTQLTAEIRTDKGWVNPRGKRNEAFDLLGYALAICIHPPIKLELIDWENPPSWADEWDKNSLVFDPTTQTSVNHSGPKGYDLAKLAEALA